MHTDQPQKTKTVLRLSSQWLWVVGRSHSKSAISLWAYNLHVRYFVFSDLFLILSSKGNKVKGTETCMIFRRTLTHVPTAMLSSPLTAKSGARRTFPSNPTGSAEKVRAGWAKAEEAETDSVIHRCDLRPCLNLFISKAVICEKLFSGLENDSVGRGLAEFRSPACTEEAWCYDSQNPSTGWSETETLLGTHWLAQESVRGPD